MVLVAEEEEPPLEEEDLLLLRGSALGGSSICLGAPCRAESFLFPSPAHTTHGPVSVSWGIVACTHACAQPESIAQGRARRHRPRGVRHAPCARAHAMSQPLVANSPPALMPDELLLRRRRAVRRPRRHLLCVHR